MKCENCGRDFEQKCSQHKFCSDDCKLAPRVLPTANEKSCSKCGCNRSASEFYRRKNGYLSELCRKHFLERRHDGFARWRREKLPIRKAMMRSLLEAYKSRPCMDCSGEFPTYCMDLDHRDMTTKTASFSDLVRTCTTKEAFEAELVKCDVVCAICHRIRTFENKIYLERPERLYRRRTKSILRTRKPASERIPPP